MKAIDIIEAMDRWVPKEFVDSWDNTGFQIGDPNKEVEKILIALDLDEKVLEKAVNDNFQMVITHHPIIFQPLTSLTKETHNSNIIYQAIKNDIVVYNAHSNLDLVYGGVNDKLAEILGLKNLVPLSLTSKFDKQDRELGYGRLGEIEETSFIAYLEIVKRNLNASHLIVYSDKDKKETIKKVAVCGGSGSDFIVDAYKQGADLFITGDIKYHDGQFGHELGLTIIDAGHFNTEKIILPTIKDYLIKELGNSLVIEVLMESNVPQFIY